MFCCLYPPPAGRLSESEVTLTCIACVTPNWKRRVLIDLIRRCELESLDAEQADVSMPPLTLSILLAAFPFLFVSLLCGPFSFFVIAGRRLPLFTPRPLPFFLYLCITADCFFLSALSFPLISCLFLRASCTLYQPHWLHRSNAPLSAGDYC